MNNKGQAAMVGLMIGVMVFMVAMLFIAPLADVIDQAREGDDSNPLDYGLDCDESEGSITDGQKATCLVVDLILPYFIAVVLAVGAGYISARFV